jgi:branched-chain amino acid transport system substrate-binding protein
LAEIAKTTDYDGILGKWSFDADGDTSSTLVTGDIVKNKAFVFDKLLAE